MGVNVKTAEELTGISLTMSAGVLPVIVKLLPVLGGVQTHIHTLTTLPRRADANIPSLFFLPFSRTCKKAPRSSDKRFLVVF